MTYAMFDDQTPDNPKLMQAGPLAGWLWFSAICWCNRHPSSNGVVTIGALRRLWSAYGTHQARTAAIASLVRCKLFAESTVDGYAINDWDIYQAEAVAKGEQRRRDRERKRRARAEAARQVSDGQGPDTVADTTRTLARARDPVPVPVPHSPKGELDTRKDRDSDQTPTVIAEYRVRYIEARPELGDWQQGARHWQHFHDIAVACADTKTGFEVALVRVMDRFFADPWATSKGWPPSALASGFLKYYANLKTPDPEVEAGDRRRARLEEINRETYDKILEDAKHAVPPPEGMLESVVSK